MQRLMRVVKAVLLPLAVAAVMTAVHAADVRPSVPYVPTPLAVVDRMLAMGRVTAQDYLIDLGSGDGRIVVTAAKKFGTRGFGVDLNPVRISEANDNARRNNVADKVAFYQRDLFETDLSQATVITMYLLPRVNLALRPKLLELKPGTRLVSHDFDMGDWKADEYVRMDAADKFSPAATAMFICGSCRRGLPARGACNCRCRANCRPTKSHSNSSTSRFPVRRRSMAGL